MINFLHSSKINRVYGLFNKLNTIVVFCFLFMIFNLKLASQTIESSLNVNVTTPDYPIHLLIEKNESKDVSIIRLKVDEPSKFASYKVNKEFVSISPQSNNILDINCNSEGETCFSPDGTSLISFLVDSSSYNTHIQIDYLNKNYQSITSQTLELRIPSDVGLAPPCSQSFLNLNTGVNVLDGQVDPNWTYGSNAPAYAFSFSYPAQSPNAKWINYFPHNGGYSNFVASFERKFCATSETNGFLSFCVAADNIGKVYFNNNFIGQTTTGKYGFMYFACFQNVPVTILAGTNILRVDVENIEGSTGFIVTNSSIVTSTGNLGLTSDACCNGNVQGRITGRKLWDKNCNSKVDAGDVGVSNWTITLVDPSSNTQTTTTDIYGNYTFANLLPGNYTVFESITQGWSQSSSAGPYNVYVAPNSINYRDFLNCKPPECEDLFTQTDTSDECCQASFSITNFNNAGLQTLSYVVVGGVINSISSNCITSSNPINLNNTSSGSISFDPNCTAQQVSNFFINASSTTADGKVCIEWTATFLQGGQVFECKKTMCINCERMPLNCNTKYDVTPNAFAPLNTDYRKFTIYNTKIPLSTITQVKIKFINESQPPHIGGGLVVDGVNKVWTYGNSGGPQEPYTDIRLFCYPSQSAHSNPAINYLSFNLGVDNTTIPQYTGIVNFTVIYCDGDTCEFSYNWLPPSKNNYNPTLRTFDIVEKVNIFGIGVTMPESAVSFSITIQDTNANLLAITAPVLDYTTNRKLFSYNSFMENNTALYLYNGKNDSFGIVEQKIYVAYSHNNENSEFGEDIQIRYFDADGREIGSSNAIVSTIELSNINDITRFENSMININISPNPVKDFANLELILEKNEIMTIGIYDINSNEIEVLIKEKELNFGTNKINFTTENLTSGTYFIIAKTSDNRIFKSKFIVVK